MTDQALLTQISQALTRLREKKKLTYQEFADQAGLHRSHYKRIEAGKSITIRTLNKILEVHNLTFKQFSEQELN